MEDTTPNTETNPEGSGVNPSDGEGTAPNDQNQAASESNQNAPSVKDVIGKALNMEFKSDEAALKTVAENRANATKFHQELQSLRGESTSNEPEATPNQDSPAPTGDTKALEEQIRQLQDENFYGRNKQYDTPEFRDTLDAIRTKTGKSLQEASEEKSFQTLFEKISSYDSDQQAKADLETSSKLGQVTDKSKKVEESLKAMNNATQSNDVVGAQAAHANAIDNVMDMVNDSYQQK